MNKLKKAFIALQHEYSTQNGGFILITDTKRLHRNDIDIKVWSKPPLTSGSNRSLLLARLIPDSERENCLFGFIRVLLMHATV